MKRKVNINRLAIFVICCWTLGIASAQASLLKNSLTKNVPLGISADAISTSGTQHGAGTDALNNTGNSPATAKTGLRIAAGHAFTFVPEPSTTVPLLGALLALAAFVIVRRRRLSVSRQ